jgi:hypothetical protein
MRDEEYILQDKELRDAGTMYSTVNILLFFIPLVGIFYFLHFFCYKDSLGKRRRLVWAMNLIMIYSLLICIFHIYMMSKIFGIVGVLLSIQTLVYNIIGIGLFFWWRRNIVRFYRDWTSVRGPRAMIDEARRRNYQ